MLPRLLPALSLASIVNETAAAAVAAGRAPPAPPRPAQVFDSNSLRATHDGIDDRLRRWARLYGNPELWPAAMSRFSPRTV